MNPYFIKGTGGKAISDALRKFRTESRKVNRGEDRLNGFSVRYPKSKSKKKPPSPPNPNQASPDTTSPAVPGNVEAP